MSHNHIKQHIFTALFATIIFLGTTFFKIPTPTGMVHIGNALVVVAFLALGTRKSMIAASVGFGLFDLLNGYAASIFTTILESLIVLAILGMVYKLLHEKDTIQHIIILSSVAGISKFLIIFCRRLIENILLIGNDSALIVTLVKMQNSVMTSIVTIIAVPIIYFALKKYIPQLFLKHSNH